MEQTKQNRVVEVVPLKNKKEELRKAWLLIIMTAILFYPLFFYMFSGAYWTIYVYLIFILLALIAYYIDYQRILIVTINKNRETIHITKYKLFGRNKSKKYSLQDLSFMNFHTVKSPYRIIIYNKRKKILDIPRDTIGIEQTRTLLYTLKDIGAEWVNEGVIKVD